MPLLPYRHEFSLLNIWIWLPCKFEQPQVSYFENTNANKKPIFTSTSVGWTLTASANLWWVNEIIFCHMAKTCYFISLVSVVILWESSLCLTETSSMVCINTFHPQEVSLHGVYVNSLTITKHAVILFSHLKPVLLVILNRHLLQICCYEFPHLFLLKAISLASWK